VEPDPVGLAGDPLEAAGREFTTLVRRVSGLSPAALHRRREGLDRWLAEVRELTAAVVHRALPILPVVADHSVTDAVAVVGSDLLAVLADHRDDAVALDLVRVTRAALEETR
jgi:hypothetical protein